jgi:hypothetical protein
MCNDLPPRGGDRFFVCIEPVAKGQLLSLSRRLSGVKSSKNESVVDSRLRGNAGTTRQMFLLHEPLLSADRSVSVHRTRLMGKVVYLGRNGHGNEEKKVQQKSLAA